jgi:dihydroflavonol-4-reductase
MTAPPRRAFLTGATGFLGYAVAQALCARGVAVDALTRRGDLPGDLLERGVRPVRGDLGDRAALRRALEGSDVIFHVAADVSMWRARWATSYEANVEGTRVLVDAALDAGVVRFVFTSSGSTLGKPWQHPPASVVTIDERDAYNLAPLHMVYPHTKWLAEELVLRAMDRGLDPVITHPTAIFGPNDWKGNLLPLFRAARGLGGLAVPRGYRTTCDVRDVAEAHLRLAERGGSGERYALGGEVLSVHELFARIARAVGGRPPRFSLPDGLLIGLGRALDAAAELTGKAPLLSEEMARQATFKVGVSSAKAEAAVGYRSRPLDESLADAVAWYRQQGLL